MIIAEHIDQVVEVGEAREFFAPKLADLEKRAREVDALHEQLLQRS
jgi:hypothetical protein